LNSFIKKQKTFVLNLAPAFDLTEALKIFPTLSEFISVSVDNECKEVLILFRKESPEPICSAVILDKQGNTQKFSSPIDIKNDRNLVELKIGDYFYETDAAIRKLKLSPVIANQFSMSFVNETSDYLIKNEMINKFPGRSFQIIDIQPFNVKSIKKHLATKKIVSANIARNHFPHSPEKIKNMLKLKDGGNEYLFFTRDKNEKLICIHCRKMK
jgi:hypothetical protein